METTDAGELFRDPEDFISYRDLLAPVYEQLKVDLRVLVWGPGETSNSRWWEKRADLITTLREANPGDEVASSEELFRQQGEPPVEYGHFEIYHAKAADIILALVLASPSRQGGVYRELEIIAGEYDLREKTHIFLPLGARAYLERFQSGALRAYREDHKHFYPWSVLTTCEKVTAASIGLVSEERKQRMYRKMESARRSSR